MAEMRYTDQYLDDLDSVGLEKNVEKFKGSRILVTGATGLIGSCVTDTLLALNANRRYGMEIRLAGRSEENVQVRFSHWGCKSFAFEEFDALDPKPLQGGYDVIVHCASNAHPSAYICNPVETALANVIGTNHLLREAAASRSRFLYLSSSEVYGNRPGNSPYKEDGYSQIDILNPRSCYPCSKRMAENLCASYAIERGVSFVVARPGHVYGPTITASDSRAHAQFARAAAAGRPIVMKSDGLQLRSYCYVIDCVTALMSILLNGGDGEAYNVSYAASVVTVRRMAEAFAVAGGVNLVFDTPTDVEKRSYNPMSCSALDGSKLESLGWKGRFSMDEGAKRTLECMGSVA